MTTAPAPLNGPASAKVVVIDHKPPGTSVSVETVKKLEPITVSIDSLRAALLCVSKEETRMYLNGVFVHRTPDGFVRAVSTDGHRLLLANLYREASDQPGPSWLKVGVIIPADQLAGRLALIDKSQDHLPKGNRPVSISFALGSKHLEISDAARESVFRVQPIDGSFPDYSKLIGGFGGAFDDVEVGEFRPTAFEPAYLKSVGDIATRIGAKQVVAYDMPDHAREVTKNGKTTIERDRSATLFTFGGLGVGLVVMPMRTADVMPDADRLLLAPVIKSSIAALKAHETRNRTAAKKLTGQNKAEAIAKADAFKSRILELLARTGSGVVSAALPAPKPLPPTKPGNVSGVVAGGGKITAVPSAANGGGTYVPGINAKEDAARAFYALGKLSVQDIAKAKAEAKAETKVKAKAEAKAKIVVRQGARTAKATPRRDTRKVVAKPTPAKLH